MKGGLRGYCLVVGCRIASPPAALPLGRGEKRGVRRVAFYSGLVQVVKA